MLSPLKTIIDFFENVYIDEKSKNSEIAERLLFLFPKNKIEFVKEAPFRDVKGRMTKEQYDKSKRRLYLKPYEGQFLKRCPGVHQKKAINCCNYYVLNLGQQCQFDCSYCYLQGYINNPVTLMFSNLDKTFEELDALEAQHSQLPYRIGTGEVIDSLSLDPLNLYSLSLIKQFNKYPHWFLELKTKSNYVDQLLDSPHKGNIIISWSLNTPHVISSEEHRTASLIERFEAAQKCLQRGFRIAFHLDPLIWYSNWKKEYSDLVYEINERFDAKDVFSISLGGLRFQPEQRHLVRERFGMKSLVVSSEVFLSDEGKFRYDFNVRRIMFDHMIRLFKSLDQNWNLTLCMETPETWMSSFEKTPLDLSELKPLFRPLGRIFHEGSSSK